MIIGLLVCVIGIIPIVLAISTRKIFKGSDLSIALLIYMVLISIWQANIGILYFKGLINESWILMLFKLLRIAPTYAIPIVFYVTCTILKNSTITLNDHIYARIVSKIFTRKVLVLLFIWSTIVYFLNWTTLGIKGLTIKHVYYSETTFYFPVYGPWNWVYKLHMSSIIVLLFFIFILSNTIQNKYTRGFLKNFSIYSLLLFILGFMNFLPGTGAVASSIGVVIFSVMIIFSFIKINLRTTLKYNQLIERQKKMDYTGNLVGSLIHEVQNTVQVIKGFNQMLERSPVMTTKEKEMIDIIQRATKQIEDLSYNYRQYIKFSKLEFMTVDLNDIIMEAIEFSNVMITRKNIHIQFHKKYNAINAFVNKPYFQQVLINLIKNSAEAIPKESYDRKIKIETEIVNESIYIHLKDTGKGIPFSNWESIFDPFISSKEAGMGMGLPFVKKILFEHRGDIKIVNSSPQGTHFQIDLPQYELSDL